ncbi:hypothetical protein GCM10022393_12380 [Aquimarina addita]|uniref:PKD domain-containing protein n=1 Tax=Aquimarina addita TaxID=870485 RepID=A0ABP7XEA8_9FLAO
MFKKEAILVGIALLCYGSIFSQNKTYKAGEVYTENQYQYGKMEIRMLAATGSGVISNFFTFKEGSELPSTFWEEIDIEVFGKDGANSWQSNLITGQGNTNLTRTEGIHPQNGLGETYHTYTIEWKPNAVVWSVDGMVARTITGGQAALMTSDTSLRFNIWNPNIPEWVGAFNENILPVHMFVNWIKFYEWNGSSFSTTPTMEDNFEIFDTNTWTKANHTFAENMADFVPENITTKDGYLILSLTKAGQEGYEGNPPTDDDIVIHAPTAIAEASVSTGEAPLSVSFDASKSYDPQDETLTYEWDFGDNSTGIGATPTHIYTNNGSYTAVVKVTNTSGGTASAGIDIDVKTVDGGTSGCVFDTPISTPLPSINRSYTGIYSIGTGGPDVSNITNFTINWDLYNNGLWQLSFNTNNGSPSWWINLKSISNHTFANTQPSLNFEGSGIEGLDGLYDVSIIDNDFVMVSKTGAYSLYFTESDTAPNCNKTSSTGGSKTSALRISPNPSNTYFTIPMNTWVDSMITLDIYDISGKKIHTIISNETQKNEIRFGDNLTTGMYFLKIYSDGSLHKEATIIKE